MRDMIYSYVKGDARKAAEIHARLLPLFTSLFLVSNPQAVNTPLIRLGLMSANASAAGRTGCKNAALIDEALKISKIDLPVK